MNICAPEDPNLLKENLGEILTGSRTYSTNYKIKINQNEYCKILCKKNLSKANYNSLHWLISKEYTMNWYLDYLPAGEAFTINPIENSSQKEIKYNGGIPIGFFKREKDKNTLFIYNHYRMYVYLNQVDNKYMIVGFEIEPFSINQANINTHICNNNTNQKSIINLSDKKEQNLSQGEEIVFTYDVEFFKTNITFENRFNPYEHINKNIHWIGIINSNIIILVLTFLTILVFVRSLKKDIEIYNTRVTKNEIIDEYGWKQVANDVFRKPIHPDFLSAFIGTGIQILIMIFYTLLFAVFGFFRPESRGSLLTMMIMVFIFLSVISGYSSARIFKSFHSRNWVRCALMTALLFPMFCFILLMLVNWLYRLEGSNIGLEFNQITSVIVLWICCSTPLVLVGSFIGAKQKTIETPGKINLVPSPIPLNKPWYLKMRYSCWFTGILPFAGVFVEFIYIMSSIWKHEIYFLARFVFLALIVIIIISSEIGLLYVYVNLCKGDYNWWWKCFGVCASSAIYFVVYSVYYFFTLKITRLSTIIIYCGLMGLITFIIVLMCGSVGVVITFMFLRKIYSMLKVD